MGPSIALTKAAYAAANISVAPSISKVVIADFNSTLSSVKPETISKTPIPFQFLKKQLETDLNLSTLPWIHPIRGELLRVTRLLDTNEIVALGTGPGAGGPDTSNIYDSETGQLIGNVYRDSLNGGWYRGGLKGGVPTNLQASSTAEALALSIFEKPDVKTHLDTLATAHKQLKQTKRDEYATTLPDVRRQLKKIFPEEIATIDSLDFENLKSTYKPKLESEKAIAQANKEFLDKKTAKDVDAQKVSFAIKRKTDNPTAADQIELAKKHLINDHYLISLASQDIMGTHNKDNFMAKINRIGLAGNEVEAQTAAQNAQKLSMVAPDHEAEESGIVPGSVYLQEISSANGIVHYKYGYWLYPKKSDGSPDKTGVIKKHVGEKTVYDPAIISDDDMLALGVAGYRDLETNGKLPSTLTSTVEAKLKSDGLSVPVNHNGNPVTLQFYVDQYGNVNSFYPILPTPNP